MDRSQAILVCPDNDAEARMILMLAEKAKIATVKSGKPHGGKLDLEIDEVKKLITGKTKEVWIVELPSLEKEEKLRRLGLEVKVIDHHTYGNFDRLTNPETGEKNPSSLEQFLNVSKITDEEIKN
jgi:inorganic pyrophosphatase/exopolyphosphatase